MSLTDDNRTCVELWQIIAHYGYAHQKGKAIEELTELAQALSRDLQGDGDRMNITEEMADCCIMLGQLQLIYGNTPELERTVEEKIFRTLRKIEAERKGEATAVTDRRMRDGGD